jgi:hypothetical protein
MKALQKPFIMEDENQMKNILEHIPKMFFKMNDTIGK